MALRLEPGLKLVAATHNPGKVPELKALMEGRFDMVSAGELGLPEPEETENSFVGNALLKARAAAEASGLVALADDSGLCVAALNGAPGIYSARWAGPTKDFKIAMAEVQKQVEASGSDDRRAWFTSALAVCWPNGPGVVFEGHVHGTLTFPPRGDNGFGYNPIFIPQGHDVTFAQMDAGSKNALSHRARAFDQLKAALF